MPNKHPSLEFPENMIRYATDVAGWQMDEAEHDMQEHPENYPEYTCARERMTLAEADLISKLGGDSMALEEYHDSNNAYAAALAIEMYLRGVMDGGRMYHSFTTRAFPQRRESNE